MKLAALIYTLSLFFEKFGYPLIFFASFIEITPFGWLFPGGSVLIIASFFSNNSDRLNPFLILLIGTLGAWTALLLSYLLGKKTGNWLVKKLKQEKNARFAKHLLKKNGGIILTTSLLSNLTRFWISYISGVENYNFFKFNLYALFASFGWASLMVLAGFLAGYERERLTKFISSIGILAWVLVIIALLVIYKSVKHEYWHFKKDEPHYN